MKKVNRKPELPEASVNEVPDERVSSVNSAEVEKELLVGEVELTPKSEPGPGGIPARWDFKATVSRPEKTQHAEAQERYRDKEAKKGVQQVNIRVPTETAEFFRALAREALRDPDVFADCTDPADLDWIMDFLRGAKGTVPPSGRNDDS